jgi:hypothetical protein
VAADLLVRRRNSMSTTRPVTATTAAVTPPTMGHIAAPGFSHTGGSGTDDTGSVGSGTGDAGCAGLGTGDAGDAGLGMPCTCPGTPVVPSGTLAEGSAAESLVALGAPATTCR